MEATEPDAASLPASIRNFTRSTLGLLQTRLELLAVELQVEKLRTLRLLLWLGVATALAIAAILIAAGALALWLWRTAGYAGLIALAVVALAGAAGVFLLLRRQILHGPEPFAATIAEFKKDASCLRTDD